MNTSLIMKPVFTSHKDLVFKFIAFSIIYLSAAVEICCSENSLIGSIIKLLFMVSVLFFVIDYISTKFKKNCFITLLITLLFFIFALQSTKENVLDFISYIFKFLLIFFFCQYCIRKSIDFDGYLFRVILFIATYSLILFIPLNVLKLTFFMQKFFVAGNDDFYYSFFGLYYFREAGDASINMGPLSIARLSSLFWEPGVYGVFLSYALYYRLNYNRIVKYDLLVLILNILFTFSTTSICIMLVLIGIKYLKNLKWYIKLAIIIPAILFVGSCIAFILLKKMNASSNGLNSYGTRMLDITVGFFVFTSNPLFGTGFFNMDYFRYIQKLNRNPSNGLIIWLFTMGINGIVFSTFPFVLNFFSCNKQNLLKKIIYIGMLLLLSMTEPIPTSPFMTYILAKEYSMLGKKNEKK